MRETCQHSYFWDGFKAIKLIYGGAVCGAGFEELKGPSKWINVYHTYPAKEFFFWGFCKGGRTLRMYTGMYARTLSPHFFPSQLREDSQKTWSESDMGTLLIE